MKPKHQQPQSDDARDYVAALLKRIRAEHNIPAGRRPGRKNPATAAVFAALKSAADTRQKTHGNDDAMFRVLDQTLTQADAIGDAPGWSPWDWFEGTARTGKCGGDAT